MLAGLPVHAIFSNGGLLHMLLGPLAPPLGIIFVSRPCARARFGGSDCPGHDVAPPPVPLASAST